jgi:hypothetical protein
LNADRIAQVGLTLTLLLVLTGSSAGAAPSRNQNVYVANGGSVSQYDVAAGGLLGPKTRPPFRQDGSLRKGLR